MNFDVELTEIADGMARRNGGSPENALAFLKFLKEGLATEGYMDGGRPAVFLTVKGQQATATQVGFDDICRRSGIVRR
jgi:hypothetical protein